MTNFIEEQQMEASKSVIAFNNRCHEHLLPIAYKQTMDEVVAQTITNTLNAILDSGLLDEYKREHDPEGVDIDPVACRQQAHNTLARDIKEFISNMDKV
jgi:hypothetical protein